MRNDLDQELGLIVVTLPPAGGAEPEEREYSTGDHKAMLRFLTDVAELAKQLEDDEELIINRFAQ